MDFTGSQRTGFGKNLGLVCLGSSHSRSDREDNLTDGSGSEPGLNEDFFLTEGGTVHDDESEDILTDSLGDDWLFLGLGD